MSILKLKPHRIKLLKQSQSYRNERGDWVTSAPELIHEESCDVVGAGKANERQFEDGKRKTYSFTIYLDKDCQEYHIGDHVELELSTGLKYTFVVLGFVRYQTQAKLWV